MAIVFRDKAQARSNSDTSLTVTKPAGVLDSDLLVAWCDCELPNATFTADTGVWIEFAVPGPQTTMSMKAFYREASSEPASWTFSHDLVANDMAVQVGIFYNDAGVGAWTLEDDQYSRGDGINTLNTVAITAIANSLYVLGCGNDDDENVTIDPVGPTKLFEVGGAGAPDGFIVSLSLASWFELVGAGEITDSITWSGGTEEIIAQAGVFSSSTPVVKQFIPILSQKNIRYAGRFM